LIPAALIRRLAEAHASAGKTGTMQEIVNLMKESA